MIQRAPPATKMPGKQSAGWAGDLGAGEAAWSPELWADSSQLNVFQKSMPGEPDNVSFLPHMDTKRHSDALRTKTPCSKHKLSLPAAHAVVE